MSTLLALRASAMPRAFRCAGSVRLPELRIDETSEASALGTAVHEALRRLAERGAVDWDGLPGLANRYEVELDELRALCAIATKLWPSVKASFPSAISEADLTLDLPEAVLTGHIDLISVAGDVARAADWKSGRKDSDYSEQMRAYGALVLLTYPQLREVTVTIIWLRDGEIENYTMDRADAVAWSARLERDVVRWDGVFRPGTHCHHCPRSHECAAANALLRRDIAILTDREIVARMENELASMDPAEVVELVEKARAVDKLCDRICAAAKAFVLERGDLVAEGRGRLTIQRDPRRELDAALAWPVLEGAGFTDEDFASVMKLSISKVEKRIAERAGKGKGAAAVREIDAALEAAGAISVSHVEKLVARRDTSGPAIASAPPAPALASAKPRPIEELIEASSIGAPAQVEERAHAPARRRRARR